MKTDEEISTEALEAYEVEGSLFEKITVLEQEKVVAIVVAIGLSVNLNRVEVPQAKPQTYVTVVVGTTTHCQ